MDAKRFAEGYSAVLSPAEIHKYPHSPLIADAQQWSHEFGMFLHGVLTGSGEGAMTPARIREYHEWQKEGFNATAARLFDAPTEHALEARSELNFHVLNRYMLGMWEPLLKGGWSSDAQRNRYVATAQDMLALEGSMHFDARHYLVEALGGHALYNGVDHKDANMRHIGAVQEIDVAILGLEMVRTMARTHPQLTILPAPLQFERSRRSGRNVDLIVVDMAAWRAVGMQVKTRVTSDAVTAADRERVVFVDGSVDLDNVRAVKMSGRGTYTQVKPWPGLIAAKRMERIRTHGPGTKAFKGNATEIVRRKLAARQLLGNTRVDYNVIAQRIGDRVIGKL